MVLLTALIGGLMVTLVTMKAFNSNIRADFMEDTIIRVYDTDGFLSQSVPRHVGISNMETQNCKDIEALYDVQETHQVQVVKKVDYPVVVLQYCNVKVRPALIFCGHDGIYRYQYPGVELKERQIRITRSQCGQLINDEPVVLQYEHGSLRGNITIEGGSKVQTSIRKTILGERYVDGDCKGGILVDGKDHLHKNVIYDVEVTLRTDNITGTYSNGVIRVKDLVSFKAETHGNFVSSKLGQIFYNFDDMPTTECNYYKRLNSGKAIVHKARQTPEYQDIISVMETDNSSMVTLLLDQDIEICGRKGYSTNEEGLFVVIDELKGKGKPLIPDISSYDFSENDVINSRITTMFLDLGKKLRKDFHSTLQEICISRKAAVINAVSSYGQQGNTGLLDTHIGVEVITQGAVSYMVWGNPLPAKIRQNNQCCIEMPIMVQSSDGTAVPTYMDPRTSVIRPYCTRRACDPSLPYTYHVKVYKSARDAEGESQYFCTRSTPEITKCEDRPLVFPIMNQNITMEVDSMLSKKTINPRLVSKETLKAHHDFMLTRGAQWSIMADTAKDFVDDSPDILSKVVSDSSTSDTFLTFKTSLFQSLAPYFSRLWTDIMTIVAGILVFLVVLAIVHRLIIMGLKRMTHLELPTRELGFSLGGKRIVKHMDKRHENLEEELRKLTTENLRNEAKWNRVMDKIDNVRDRLVTIEEENPTTALRNLSSKLTDCQTH